MRTITNSDRKRATGFLFTQHEKGDVSFKRIPYYSYYHVRDITRDIQYLNKGQVLLINYQHGHTFKTISKILNNFKSNLCTHIKSKDKYILIYKNSDRDGLNIVRRILSDGIATYTNPRGMTSDK